MKWQKIKSNFLFEAHNYYLVYYIIAADDGEMIDEHIETIFLNESADVALLENSLRKDLNERNLKVTHIMLITYPKN